MIDNDHHVDNPKRKTSLKLGDHNIISQGSFPHLFHTYKLPNNMVHVLFLCNHPKFSWIAILSNSSSLLKVRLRLRNYVNFQSGKHLRNSAI